MIGEGVADQQSGTWAMLCDALVDGSIAACDSSRHSIPVPSFPQLNRFLDQSESQLESLEARIVEAEDTYDALSQEMHVVGDEQMALYWDLLHCPARLTEVVVAWKRRAGAARVLYMDQLRDDQAKLAVAVEALEREVHDFVKLGDLSAVEDRHLQVRHWGGRGAAGCTGWGIGAAVWGG